MKILYNIHICIIGRFLLYLELIYLILGVTYNYLYLVLTYRLITFIHIFGELRFVNLDVRRGFLIRH